MNVGGMGSWMQRRLRQMQGDVSVIHSVDEYCLGRRSAATGFLDALEPSWQRWLAVPFSCP